jgi:hypothetical protein
VITEMTKQTDIIPRNSDEDLIRPIVAGLPPTIWIVTAFAARPFLPAWGFMWALAFSHFLASKWLTLFPHLHNMPARLVLLYLLTDPGMNAKEFLQATNTILPPRSQGFLAAARAAFGAILLFLIAPTLSGLASAMTGLLGLVLLLHFGLLDLLAFAHQRAGRSSTPLMDHPLRSTSLADLWSRRWNTGFTALTRQFLFRPMAKITGPTLATAAVFLASGLIHDLVISLPAQGGYGLPTLYFLIQFTGLLIEHLPTPRRIRRAWPITGRLFTIFVALAPLPLLFHAPFLHNVILPFIHALSRSTS